MIRITRLDGKELTLNAELIQTVEQTPDTVITLTNGITLMVRESEDEVVRRVKSYKRQVALGPRESQ